MPSTPIQTPSSYVASHAAAFADPDGSAVIVSSSNPLPVTFDRAATSPLAGAMSTSGQVGPFSPIPGRAVVLALSGAWDGTARVLRSTDNGATRLPLTVAGQAWGQFTGNCCEAVWEESEPEAKLYLDISLASGTLAYRFGQ